MVRIYKIADLRAHYSRLGRSEDCRSFMGTERCCAVAAIESGLWMVIDLCFGLVILTLIVVFERSMSLITA